MKKEEETYIGDGLYASFDGFGVKLRAPRDREDHWVYLEPEILFSFIRFLKEQGFRIDITS